MTIRNTVHERAETNPLRDAGEGGETDPRIGLHRGMIEDVAAIEAEGFNLTSGFEQPGQAFVTQDELNAPPNPVVGCRNPRMSRHASRSLSVSGRSRYGLHRLPGLPGTLALSAQPIDRRGDPLLHTIGANHAQGLEEPR